MNTTATDLPNNAAMQVAPFAALYDQRSKLRVWAFAAAVRLSDQDKPIALKLLVELAIVIRMLALLAHHARCATGKTVVAHRAPRPVCRIYGRRVKPGKRTVAVYVRQPVAVSVRRTAVKRTHSTTSAGLRPRLKCLPSAALARGRRLLNQAALGFAPSTRLISGIAVAGRL